MSKKRKGADIDLDEIFSDSTPTAPESGINDILEVDGAKPSKKQKKQKPHREKKKFSFGRFLLSLIIIAAALVNAWTFVELLRVDLLVVSVTVSQSDLNLFENESQTLSADIRSYGLSETLGLAETTLIWESDDPSVVSVNDDGTVTALSPGTATVTAAESRTGLSDSCTITVHSLTDILLNAETCALGAGEIFTLEAAVSSNDLAEPFEFFSSAPLVAEVDENGSITALSPGEAIITASARGYTSSQCSVTVYSAPTYLTIINSSANMCLGESRVLDIGVGENEFCSNYSYQSSDPAIISVDASGKMTANAEGTATVTVESHNGLSSSLTFTVAGTPAEIELEHSKLTIYSGCTQTLNPADSTGNCLEYYYTSSDSSIASVDENGVITALNHGSATITCTSYNGKSDSCTVTVKIVDYVTPYTYDRVEQNISALVSSYPELISTEVVGQSVMGRNITLVKLGNGERKALVVAGLHSRENITVTFTMRCIEEYAEAYYSKSGKYGPYNIKRMLDEFTLYLVPLMNPDGLDIVTNNVDPIYEGFSSDSFDRAKFKNNANGVNLNRNFPFMWGYSDTKHSVNVTTPDTDSYAGASAGSEPETQAMMKLCNDNAFEWLLDVHCRGYIMYYQDKFNEVTAADNRLASLLSRKCGFTLQDKSTAYEISGGFENWFRAEFGKPGICIELVKPEFSYVVNGRFDDKLNWSQTRYSFLQGMVD